MFQSYFKIAIRSITRQKIFSAISILGLSVGLACSILILLFVSEELSFDHFHEKKENIYRVLRSEYNAGRDIDHISRNQPAAFAPLLQDFFPDIKQIIRVKPQFGTARFADKIFNEIVLMTDEGFFETFSFQLLQGNPNQVLNGKNNIVLSESYARKYFGDESPLGKALLFTFGQNQQEFIVRGIVEDAPANSTIQYNIIMNIANLPLSRGANALTNLGDFSTTFYFLLPENHSPATIDQRFPAFTEQYLSAEIEQLKNTGRWEGEGKPYDFHLQPLLDVHLDGRIYGGSNPKTIFILSAIALIILGLACGNFINLSIGNTSMRMVEMGMRKVMGAWRRQFLWQFWSETFLVTLISVGFGIMLCHLMLPAFNSYVGRDLLLSNLITVENLAVLGGLLMLVTTAVSSYPAFLLARQQPAILLKSPKSIGSSRLTSRLVIIQFSMAIFLIIATLIMGDQINFMLNQDPGFRKDGLVVVDIQEREPAASKRVYQRFRNEARRLSNVQHISATSDAFGRSESRSYLHFQDREILTYRYNIDENYAPLLELSLMKGRNLSGEFATDSAAALVNEKLVETLSLDDPVGSTVLLHGKVPLHIVGVIEDYHFSSLASEIRPAILYNQPARGYENILLRLSATNMTENIAALESIWQSVQPEKPFQYSILEEDLAAFYLRQQQTLAIVRYASAFAILISCMGIFGLTILAIHRRLKEIGIRKVLGARVSQITYLLIKDFLLLLIIANLIAWPAGYYFADTFLADYYYRISAGIGYFLLAGLISISVALLTIISLAAKAALANPIRALKYE